MKTKSVEKREKKNFSQSSPEIPVRETVLGHTKSHTGQKFHHNHNKHIHHKALMLSLRGTNTYTPDLTKQ